MRNENKVVTSAQSLEYANWQQADLAIILTGDIRHPWKSVYGFSMIAAQLAAGQPLLLHSREDEVFDLLAKLNELLGDPDSLDQAHKLLKKLEQESMVIANCTALLRLILLDLQAGLHQSIIQNN